ncbi:hypothetical protein K469DRAFT_692844 [Zopfia rhizophila CBS 207.26]|uniref:Protein kinase domain-containing protein n=1 Tax=Zopfia rhizophila CBS 207.26 TaxID=1314779 RepID=A0A6A6DMC1_9PEZI|nr:hypothetical protein K469DRAFT_692844 [Zopfia rhizophila CBS 207.26]
MPHLLPPAADSGESSRSRSRQRARTEANEHRHMWSRWSLQKIGSWLKREEEEPPPPDTLDEKHGHGHDDEANKENGRPGSSHGRPSGLLGRRSSRKVVPGLPRPLTFKRMNSEKREKLLPVPMNGEQRRAASVDRRGSSALKRTLSPPNVSIPSMSAPDVLSPHTSEQQQKPTIGGGEGSNIPAGAKQVDYGMDESIDYLSAGEPPPLSIAGDSFYERGSQRSASDIDELMLQEELEAKWILNLSMHFRDMSDREKFFITYAEEPNKWRRVTVSCDYREITPDSLEADLKSLHYQRDKSARIYEAIRDSLPDIQFYDSVTNLKLQTADGRLHVHVTEDINEIIPYPSTPAVEHLDCKKFKESTVSFDSHISGFVYKVSVGNKVYIKKEIPGPDAVEEFLYEINALCNLRDSKSVIRFEGIIVDDKNELIKGLLISYADQGALVDLIYDYKNSDRMPWVRRERWARQIVEGLSEIHEAGFVQGDFTLSNIVIDHKDDAKIIDINRRGCPVGWEPPELARLIESAQRISIYIGVKSDLFQLGMVLWALAEQQDEPERQERPLFRTFNRHNIIPEYFREIVKACLNENPRERPAAKDILAKFPDASADELKPVATSRQSVSTRRSGKEYIDPATAVDLEDIRRQRSHSSISAAQMPSTEYIGSSSSYILPNPARGRSPANRNSRHRRSDCSPYAGPHSIMSLDDSELENELASLPASRETRWEQVYVDGDTRLVQRGSLGIDAHDFATETKDVCITTPPGELEKSFDGSGKSEDTPLNMSMVAELQPPQAQPLPVPHQPQQMPIPPQAQQLPLPTSEPATTTTTYQPGHHRHPSSKASFSDRVHMLSQVEDTNLTMTNTLADLENEIAMDASVTESSLAPSRVNTCFSIDGTGAGRFSPPLHQDSGFNEPALERASYESERIRQSLEDRLSGLEALQRKERVEGRLWDEKDGTLIGEGVRGSDLVVKPELQRDDTVVPAVPMEAGRRDVVVPVEQSMEKALEEKVSNTTIRPPSILIPEFHHAVPQAVDTSPSVSIKDKPVPALTSRTSHHQHENGSTRQEPERRERTYDVKKGEIFNFRTSDITGYWDESKDIRSILKQASGGVSKVTHFELSMRALWLGAVRGMSLMPRYVLVVDPINARSLFDYISQIVEQQEYTDTSNYTDENYGVLGARRQISPGAGVDGGGEGEGGHGSQFLLPLLIKSGSYGLGWQIQVKINEVANGGLIQDRVASSGNAKSFDNHIAYSRSPGMDKSFQ